MTFEHWKARLLLMMELETEFPSMPTVKGMRSF
jgi:hypothetical protein